MNKFKEFAIFFMLVFIMGMFILGIFGCSTLRFQPTESQKQTAALGVDLARTIDAEGCQPDSTTSRTIRQTSEIAQQYIGLAKTPVDNRDEVLAQARIDANNKVTVQDITKEVSSAFDVIEPLLDPVVLSTLGLGGLGILKLVTQIRAGNKRIQEGADKVDAAETDRDKFKTLITEVVRGIEYYKDMDISDDTPSDEIREAVAKLDVSLGTALGNTMSSASKLEVKKIKLGL